MVRMSTAEAAARELARARWGNRVVVRAAQTLMERADELPAEVLAELRAATRPGCLRTVGQRKERT